MYASLLVSISILNFNFGILSKMSNMDCGKKNKTSRQNDVISYFQNAPSNNPHPIHASSSLEQGISERDVNTFENSSATQKMDGRIHSSNDQSETNAFPSEIGSSNVKKISNFR